MTFPQKAKREGRGWSGDFTRNRVKDNPKLSGYNFRTKAQQEAYEKTGKLPLGIPSIYNLDAVRFIIDELSKFV